eukprot:jgi/Chlat1/2149/Chrsp17S02724
MEFGWVGAVDARPLAVAGAQGGGAARGRLPTVRCAAFHPTLPLLSLAVGSKVAEYDVPSGAKLAEIDLGGNAVRIIYNSTEDHRLIAVLEDRLVKSWDFQTQRLDTLHIPVPKKKEALVKLTDVHVAVMHQKPLMFYVPDRKSTIMVVGTLPGVFSGQKLKLEYKKKVTALACHPRAPILAVAYLTAAVRLYRLETTMVLHASFSVSAAGSKKLPYGTAIAFHPNGAVVFLGDASGMISAWHVQIPGGACCSLAFHSTFQTLVSLSSAGVLSTWYLSATAEKKFKLEAAGEPSSTKSLLQIGASAGVINDLDLLANEPPVVKGINLHPHLNLCVLQLAAVQAAGSEFEVASFLSMRQSQRSSQQTLTSSVQSLSLDASTELKLRERLSSLALSQKPVNVSMQSLASMRSSSVFSVRDSNGAASVRSAAEELVRLLPQVCYSVPFLRLQDTCNLLRDTAICQPVSQRINQFDSRSLATTYPRLVYFMDATSLMAFDVTTSAMSRVFQLATHSPAGTLRAPVRLTIADQHAMVVFRNDVSVKAAAGSAVHEALVLPHFADAERRAQQFQASTPGASDGTTLIVNQVSFSLLVFEDGDYAQLSSLAEEPAAQVKISFERYPVRRVFATLSEGMVLFADSRQLWSYNLGPVIQSMQGSLVPAPVIARPVQQGYRLRLRETVLQVAWQETSKGAVVAMLTTQRITILSSTLAPIVGTSASPAQFGTTPFLSVLWAGPALFFTTTSHVKYLGWDGEVRTICSLHTQGTALLAVLEDRLVLAHHSGQSAGHSEAHMQQVGLLEPVVIGWLTMKEHWDSTLDVEDSIRGVIKKFDARRVSTSVLDLLCEAGLASLALELATEGPQFTKLQRFDCAVAAHRIETALQILLDEWQHTPDYPHLHPASPLYARFKDFAAVCVQHGQFQAAHKCYSIIRDLEALYELGLCDRNGSLLQASDVKSKLQPSVSESTQGDRAGEGFFPWQLEGCRDMPSLADAFINRARAQGLVAPGQLPSIANWPMSVDQKEWGVSPDTLVHMRTGLAIGEGPTTVPAAQADNVWHYLGAVSPNISTSIDGTAPAAAAAMNGAIARTSMDWSANASVLSVSSSQGSFTAGQLEPEVQDARTAEPASDAQMKASQEFRQGFGDDTSSSDEEGSEASEDSNKPKFQIRIKNVNESQGVDVQKLRSAVQTIKLGPPLAPGALTLGAPRAGGKASKLSFGKKKPAKDDSSSDDEGQSAQSQPSPTPSGMSMRPPSFTMQSPTTSSDATFSTGLPSPAMSSFPSPLPSPAPSIGRPMGMGMGKPIGMGRPMSTPGISSSFSSMRSSASSEVTTTAVSPGGLMQGTSSFRPPSPYQPVAVDREVAIEHAAVEWYRKAVGCLEQNQASDALMFLQYALVVLKRDLFEEGKDIGTQAKACGQYKAACLLMKEMERLGSQPDVASKPQVARLSRYASALPLNVTHRITFMRTCVKRNMEVQNYGFSRRVLEVLISKAPVEKRAELQRQIDVCDAAGGGDRSITPGEDPTKFCIRTFVPLVVGQEDGWYRCDVCTMHFSDVQTELGGAPPECGHCGIGTLAFV